MTLGLGKKRSRKRFEAIAAHSAIPNPPPRHRKNIPQRKIDLPIERDRPIPSFILAKNDSYQCEITPHDESNSPEITPQEQNLPPVGQDDDEDSPSERYASSHNSDDEDMDESYDDTGPIPPVPIPQPPAPPAHVFNDMDWNIRIPNWLVLWAVYLSTGVAAVTEEQFITVRTIVSTAFQADEIHWRAPNIRFAELNNVVLHRARAAFPSYTTLWRKIRPDVLRFLTIQDSFYNVPVISPAARLPEPDPTGSSCSENSDEDNDAPDAPPSPALAKINLILPSTYALMDIATPHVWEFFEQEDNSPRIPVVEERRRFYDCRSTISIDENSLEVRAALTAHIGDVIDVHLSGTIITNERLAQSFQPESSANSRILRARVADIFGIQHYSRYSLPCGADDVSSARSEPFLQFIDYDAREEHDGELITKPGDIVARLQVVTNEQTTSEISEISALLVYRFWRQEEEVQRHLAILKHPASVPPENRLTPTNSADTFDSLSETPDHTTATVAKIVLYDNSGTTAYRENIAKIPSIGKLQNEEPYVIYRFLLYHDGFTISNHNQKTANGVYIIPLQFNTFGRNTTNVGRVLTLSPPNVSPFAVFETIKDDLSRGTTDGFPGIDANGTRRRVFLDLVGILGDTPAINYGLDVKGQSGAAPCHLCSFRKRHITGKLFHFDDEIARGCRSAEERFSFRHIALADSHAQLDITQYMGISERANLPIHRMADHLRTLRDQSPTTEHGHRLLPCTLDPYSSAFVTPDHLLTGIAKNCVALAVAVLPPASRLSFQESVLLALRRNKVGALFRIISDRKLAQMTCSQVYVFIPFAPHAYAKAIRAIPNPSVDRQHRALCALDLMVDINKLIATIWRTDLGEAYVSRVQSDILRHLQKVRRLHNLPVSLRRYIHKPNLHRLYEFGFSTLPRTGHASISKELNLEKMHQTLKRSVERSNKKEPHLFAMRNVCIEDWKARLAFLSTPLSLNNLRDLRSAHRLLSGRPEVAVNTNAMPQHIIDLMNNVLIGPGVPPAQHVPAKGNAAPDTSATLVRALRKTALYRAKAYNLGGDFFQNLPPRARTYITNNTTQDPDHADRNLPFLSLPFIPSWTGNPTERPFRIHSRTTIEFHCYSFSRPGDHFPTLRQSHRSFPFNNTAGVQNITGAMYWYVAYILLPSKLSAFEDAILLLRPTRVRVGNEFRIDIIPAAPAAGNPPALPVPNPPVYTSREIIRNRPLSLARVDNTIKRVGMFPVTATNNNIFIGVRSAEGYPPQRG